ncbi:MAG: PAS domain-containing protein [Desulfobaccales bacterium]
MNAELIKVLLIEDNQDDILLIGRMLAKASSSYYEFKVDHCGSLADAKKYLNHHEPDVILLDLGLPDGRGLEAVSSIMSLASAIPLMVLTGLEDEKVAIESLQKGAQDYLLKGKITHNSLGRSLRYAIERKRSEEARSLLAAIVENSDDAIISKTLEGVITSWNRGAEIIYGYAAAEAIGQPITLLMPADGPDEAATLLAKIRRGEHVTHFETSRRRKDGANLSVSLSISPVRNRTGAIIGASTIARDISDRKRAEAEREKLILELQEALAQVKTLSGFLPICSSCKKIRDDQGYWTQLEAYIRDHSEAEFSHCICPACAKKLYGEFLDEEN